MTIMKTVDEKHEKITLEDNNALTMSFEEETSKKIRIVSYNPIVSKVRILLHLDTFNK